MIICVVLCTVNTSAQLPVYTCNFEDTTENSQWVLNPNMSKLQLENSWWIGEPGNFSPDGSKGLYISSDRKGREPIYGGSNTMFVTAARDMSHVPAGNYRLYFDWRCKGKKNGEGFYICWVPTSITTNSAPNTADMPEWVKTYKCDTVFSQKQLWTTGQVDINHDGTPRKLVFVWYSTQGEVYPPAACLDNIELRPIPTEVCATPTNIKHTMNFDTLTLTWRGNADYYNVRCYDYNNDKWLVFDSIQANTCTIDGLSEGIQTFFLRGYCGEDRASDYVQYTKFIFHKGVRCIDYMDLEGKCYVGTYTTRVKNQRPFSHNQQVDFGYDDPESRHTLHYMPDEYDAMSNYQLRTCPDGYIASVRLGDGGDGDGSGESIEYKYKVEDGASAILKIKYALVLSNPHPATPEANPQFWLDILVDNKVIKNECGFAMFTAGDSEDSGWLEGIDGWLYKDWTEHSINLSDYVGKTLTIRLVTTDCQPSAHTGYVYFVLDCEDGGLSGLNCGEDNPTTEFEAPSGFDYVWYLADEPLDTLDRDQHFQIEPLDTNVYCVNIINKNNANCWYTLTAIGKPRVPTPIATYSVYAERCQNIVTFENHSCVYLQNMVTDIFEPTTEPVTSLTWDFGDGTIERSITTKIGSTIQHVYPPEGGQFLVKLTAGISKDACLVTDSFIINLPDLSTPITDVVENVCRADYPFGYKYGDVWLYEDVDSTFTLISKKTGCDSLCHLVLRFHDVMEYTYNDTICEGDSLLFFDKVLKQSGLYVDTTSTPTGCDSIVRLQLHAEPMLQINLQDSLLVCLDDQLWELPYEILRGKMDSMTIAFDSTALAAGFSQNYVFDAQETPIIAVPDTIIPNFYTAVVSYYTTYCGVLSDTLTLELTYKSMVAIVKSNILAVKNEDFNGGYSFDYIQWYRDGELIPGATGPNLAVTPEDVGHVFSVKLVRAGEEVAISTCPIVYVPTDVESVATPLIHWPAHVYNSVGAYLGKMTWDECSNLSSGIYLLSDEKNTIKIIL